MLVITAERWVKTFGMLEGGSENLIRKMYVLLALVAITLHRSFTCVIIFLTFLIFYEGEFVMFA